MVCNNYLPRFQDQINSTDPLGPLSCTCYSGAMAADYHTCGAKRPTGRAVRLETHDYTGGTTLVQVDYALRTGWGIDLDTRIGSSRLTWTQFVNYINSGRGAIVQGSYEAIHGTRFAGDLNFRGNHAIFVPPGWGVMDPLCDGRRTGIYKYHGEKYPQWLIREFAGKLMLNPSTGRRLGLGYVWCSLTRDNTSNVKYRVSVQPLDGASSRAFFRYYVSDRGYITSRVSQRTGGFSATCTAPRLYPASKNAGFTSKRLVQITQAGTSRYHQYIDAGFAKEI